MRQILSSSARSFARSLGSVLLAIGMVASVVAQQSSDLKIMATGPRAFADAIKSLTQSTGWIITYEDPLWLDPADRIERQIPSREARGIPRQFVTRDGLIDFTHKWKSGLSEDDQIKAVVDALFKDSRDHQNPGGEFELRHEGAVYHVVPRTERTERGEERPHVSSLDALLSWESLVEHGQDSIGGILRAASAATRRPILLGQIPARPPAHVQLPGLPDGKMHSARSLLVAALKTSRARFSWRVLCEPGSEDCYLNVYSVGPK